MALDKILSSINMGKGGPSNQGPSSSEGERWLAALEQTNLEIRDNSLNPSSLRQNQGAAMPSPTRPSPSPQTEAYPPETQLRTPSAFFALPEVSGNEPPSEAVRDRVLPDVRDRHFQPHGHSSIDGLSRARVAELERLISSRGVFSAQPRFRMLSDLNIQVTENEDGVTIWIRDFKAAYGPELHAWLTELQYMGGVPGLIGSDVRLMLNGEQLSELSDILRVK